jgi:hypothetical protein
MPAGRHFVASSKAKQHTLAVEWWRSRQRIPARIVQAVEGRVQKSLSVRTHICPSCGLVMDRDANAARNIQWDGQALRGVAGVPAASNREVPWH